MRQGICAAWYFPFSSHISTAVASPGTRLVESWIYRVLPVEIWCKVPQLSWEGKCLWTVEYLLGQCLQLWGNTTSQGSPYDTRRILEDIT